LKLVELIKNLTIELQDGPLDREISGIAYDSRRVKPGDLFICISGLKSDGHLFAGQAIENGAGAVLAERQLDTGGKATLLTTPDTRSALALLAANYYGRPSKSIRVVAVTGTNGKTTTTDLIKAILEEAGKKTAIMGTLYAQVGEIQREMQHTTPEALEIESFMALCREEKADYIVMEVSSHALQLQRVAEIDFNVAVFTNLTQDHLDFHQNMDNYRAAKLQLFQMIKEEKQNYAIINIDDPWAEEIFQAATIPCRSYGIKKRSDYQAGELKIDLDGSSFRLHYGDNSLMINMKLIGLFSIYNALAAISFALQEGIDPGLIQSALARVEGVPGRFEKVDCGQDFAVIVDYAHTPDGLENILQTSRELGKKRLICVFGCGGDRDRGKRPLMGEIAAKYSDFCVVTSDNPRSEDPHAIIAEIIPGMDKVEKSRYAIIVDRREAIRHAIHLARTGDLVVIAGKGHENYQLVKDQVLEFDDRKVAAELLRGKVK
jgi:UDP-N-acetylmuramoyl-L-alanyl-D-glutamate--2,6-diaminopimelate ligase